MNSLMLFLTEYWFSFGMHDMYIVLYNIASCFSAGLFALVTCNLTSHSLCDCILLF